MEKEFLPIIKQSQQLILYIVELNFGNILQVIGIFTINLQKHLGKLLKKKELMEVLSYYKK